jgi:hypothetical protein
MSSIKNIIIRAVALWVHVGIGPLLGCGPIEACHTKQQYARKSAVSNQSQPAPTRR